MFDSVTVIGRTGRSGAAICARLRERGVRLVEQGGELFVLCVPDRAIAEVAQRIEPGPGSRTLAARRRSPRSTRTRGASPSIRSRRSRRRGPEQLDGAFGAVTAESDDAHERGLWLARTLGLEPFELADDGRVALPRGCRVRVDYLVTLHRVAVASASSPPARRRGARPADAADDRQRLRAHGPDRARRLGDDGCATSLRSASGSPSSSRSTTRLRRRRRR